MNTNIRTLFFLAIALAVLGVSVTVLATSKDDIVYPVGQLGNCENQEACFAYCDNPANLQACIAFAEAHNLMSEQELEKARKFQSIGAVGPGGCTTERECEAYCENVNNIQECLGFAEQHGFMEEEELAEARKVAAALEAGAQLPGGCSSKAQCEAYCSDASNMRECIAFAETAGFMSERELREAKQVLKALDAGVPLPGGCRGEEECEAYCENPEHVEECVEFGIAAGFIPPEEAEQVRRMIPLMKEGRMPEACRAGREECEAYCAEEENVEECTTFFVEAGIMSEEEVELFRKTGGRGPGGCKGERECEAYCNNPANQEACFAFATEHGLIPEEELGHIREGLGRLQEGLAQAPPEVAQCLKDTIGEEVLAKIEAGTFTPNPQIGDHMRRCFEEFFSQQREGEFPPGEGFGLPPEGFQQKTPEQQACIERILGDLQGPPTPELEERLARECFGAGEFEQFAPPHEQGEFPAGGEFPQRFEGEIPEGFIPPEGGTFEEQFRQEQERQFQEQFEQQFHEEPQSFEAQGNILEAALRLFLQLVPR